MRPRGKAKKSTAFTSDIAAVLMHYGAETVPEGNWQPMHCPFHDDRRTSSGVSTNDGAFSCKGCGMKGDAIALIKKVENLEYPDALQRYAEITGRTDLPLRGAVSGESRRSLSDEPRSFEGGSGLSARLGRRRLAD